MGIFRHPVTNFSGIGAFISVCTEQWGQQIFGAEWGEVSWGWIALALATFWLGAQVRQLENGDHWLQGWLKRRRSKVSFADPRYIKTINLGVEVSTEYMARKAIPNALTCLDIYRLRLGSLDLTWKDVDADCEWVRIGRSEILGQTNLNPGDRHKVPLLHVPPNGHVIPALGGPWPFTAFDEGFYRCLVIISYATGGPITKAFEFYVSEQGIMPLPLAAPLDADSFRDANNFKKFVAAA